MGRDHDPAALLDVVGELGGAVHAEDVAVDAEREDVAVVGTDLNAGEDEEVVLGAQLLDLSLVPDGVVLGEADGVEAGVLRPHDEVLGVKDTVVGLGPSVGVKVDEH